MSDYHLVAIQESGVQEELESCFHMLVPKKLNLLSALKTYNKWYDKEGEKAGFPTFEKWLITEKGCKPAKIKVFHLKEGWLS